MPVELHIRLLGAFELRASDGRPLVVDSARVRSLLAYLLLHADAPISRERLASTLWPESTDPQARTNLRHVLHTLRRVVPGVDHRLRSTPGSLRWHSEPGDTLDVTEFERLTATNGPGRLDALRAAADGYTADLLDDIDDEWPAADRGRLRDQLIRVLDELAESGRAVDTARALADADRLQRLDPLREATYRLLMQIHAAGGDRAAAVRVFHRCSDILDRELGIRPSPETESVYRALLPGLTEVQPLRRTGRRPPLVGRDGERARLAAAWRDAGSGRAQLVVVTGEPGVGKTRLVTDFRFWCTRQGVASAAAACYAAEGPLPYGVITSWLRSAQLRQLLPGLDPVRLGDLARLLPELLVDEPGLTPPIPLAEDDQRPRVFEAVAGTLDLVNRASPAPVLLLVDDLHHADRESCRLLHYLLRVRADTRLLIVGTARRAEISVAPAAELLSAARSHERLVDIGLTALRPADVATLFSRMTGDPATPEDARRLHEATGGNPLFVVEAVRAGWSPQDPRVPMTPRVQAVLESRMGRLGPVATELAAAAAVIGRPFDADLLFAAARAEVDTPGSADELVVGLDELWRHGIVAERGTGSGGPYDFTHEALRDVALTGIGPVLRSAMHRRLAGALARRAASSGVGAAEIAAHHAQAGDGVQAARWYRRAAESAQLLYAHAEAIRLLDRAVEALDSAEPSTDRDAAELAVRTAQLAPLVSEHGYASPQVAAVQERARRLTAELAADPSPPLLRSLAMTALTADDFVAARDFGGQLRSAADHDGTGVLAVEADVLLGFAAFWLAEFETARMHFEHALAGYRPDRTTAHLAGYGQDPRAVALARLGNTRWFLADPAGAVAARDEAIGWVQRLGHPYSRAAVLLFASLLDLDMADDHALREHALALIGSGAVAPPLRLSARALDGYLAVLDGRLAEGMSTVGRAVADYRPGTGAPGMRAILARIKLAACQATGDPGLIVPAADDLLSAGPAAAVWTPQTRLVRAFHAPPG